MRDASSGCPWATPVSARPRGFDKRVWVTWKLPQFPGDGVDLPVWVLGCWTGVFARICPGSGPGRGSQGRARPFVWWSLLRVHCFPQPLWAARLRGQHSLGNSGLCCWVGGGEGHRCASWPSVLLLLGLWVPWEPASVSTGSPPRWQHGCAVSTAGLSGGPGAARVARLRG